MALWAYALRTVATVKSSVWTAASTSADALIEECVNEASEMVEKAWGRDLVSRGSITEYHPRLRPTLGSEVYSPAISGPAYPLNASPATQALGSELYLNEYPIVSVTTVHEDSARAYGASTLLVADTDYVVSKPAGKLIRVSGASPSGWGSSWRAVKAVYVGGHQNTAGTVTNAPAVPNAVLRVFDELVGWMIRQRANKEVGLVVATDSLGTRTYSGPAYITTAMQEALNKAGACQGTLRLRTGERDS